jgi:hypothetical protein
MGMLQPLTSSVAVLTTGTGNAITTGAIGGMGGIGNESLEMLTDLIEHGCVNQLCNSIVFQLAKKSNPCEL